MRVSAGLVAAISGICLVSSVTSGQVTEPLREGLRFRAGVELVSVAAVVRDRNGRLVRDLKPDDFLVYDNGFERAIRQFHVDERGAVRVALLIDVSGSMRLASRDTAARQAAGQVLSWLAEGADEAAFYVFDSQLDEVVPFTADLAAERRGLDELAPYGATSIFDAAAGAARRAATRGAARSAVVLVTDGVDTASRSTAPEVAAVASAIDVPVYVLSVAVPKNAGDTGNGSPAAANALSNLAYWTGGSFFAAGTPAQASVAARQLVAELRHQYFIAFEPASEPGWRSLEVRTRADGLVVRARSGYVAGQARPVG